MPIHWPAKAPGEANEDYDLDWSGKLNAGDSIASSSWIVVGAPASITIADGGHTATLTKVFVSGGAENQVYTFQNTVVTANGETYIRQTSMLIKGQ